MEDLKDYFHNDRFATANGIELLEVAPGRARAQMTIDQDHRNSLGIAQGGAIFTLADLAFAAACNAAGRVAVAVNVAISHLKPVTAGTLHATATEVARSRSLSTCTVRVTDEDHQLVALFQGTAYIKDEPFPPSA